MAYGLWFEKPERWGGLPSSEQCGHCRAALRRMAGVDGYMREAQRRGVLLMRSTDRVTTKSAWQSMKRLRKVAGHPHRQGARVFGYRVRD